MHKVNKVRCELLSKIYDDLSNTKISHFRTKINSVNIIELSENQKFKNQGETNISSFENTGEYNHEFNTTINTSMNNCYSSKNSFIGVKNKIIISRKKNQNFSKKFLEIENEKLNQEHLEINSLSQNGFFYLRNTYNCLKNNNSSSSIDFHSKDNSSCNFTKFSTSDDFDKIRNRLSFKSSYHKKGLSKFSSSSSFITDD